MEHGTANIWKNCFNVLISKAIITLIYLPNAWEKEIKYLTFYIHKNRRSRTWQYNKLNEQLGNKDEFSIYP
ncbi:hypothetical protein [Nitrosomonas communis]|uniref:hypothetical protein n=1 Tax=Nitrosomonas communis TaxID=44574 RepID=UPI00094516D1|nr:hypothetical protein [Nitrosomonas communis]